MIPRLFIVDRNVWHFLWYGGVAGEGLRSVGADGELPIQERLLYPAPRSTFTGRGGVEHANPGPRLRGGCDVQRRGSRGESRPDVAYPPRAGRGAASTRQSVRVRPPRPAG